MYVDYNKTVTYQNVRFQLFDNDKKNTNYDIRIIRYILKKSKLNKMLLRSLYIIIYNNLFYKTYKYLIIIIIKFHIL